MREKKLSDFYWAYADILRGIGINESMYDQRIMAFMALKLLVDNDKLKFNFEYNDNFGLDVKLYKKYKKGDTKSTFLNLIQNIEDFGQNLNYFIQDIKYNPDSNNNILSYLNHFKTFELERYIQELPNNYLENVLDIYIEKAHFVDYPKEQYKDLYEKTISRMKKLSGDLTGQHFTQKSIIHLMCEYAIDDLSKSNRDILAIYDPACGTGSMLMESAFYFNDKINQPKKSSKKKSQKEIRVYGQEMHGQTWLLCKIFLEISNINNIIAYGNTLINPAFDKINGDDSFDFIIANPPFGVDWKHDYIEVIKNMELKDKSNFYVIKDEITNKIVTPKKSDGQFLFMQHIIKLLEISKKNNKHAKATVISSTGLVTSGKENSSEGIIRKNIFQSGWIDALLEQPREMFTNTDISTLIWFMDSNKTSENSNKTYLLKSDNSYINEHFKNMKLKVLYTTAQTKKDKQKNSYSEQNILVLSKMIKDKTIFELFGKIKEFDNIYAINFENEFCVSLDLSKIESNNKFDLESAYQSLTLALIFMPQINQKYNKFSSLINKMSIYVEGTYIDEFYEDYIKIYKNLESAIIKKNKNIFEYFLKDMLEQKKKEQENINYIFEELKKINSNIKLNIEILNN